MKSFKLPLILGFLALTTALFSQTIIPGGYVSGTWTSTGSPYNVQGNITILADSTLIIQPGVTVDFQGSYSLTVNGFLEAVGTETDSIYFYGTNWDGIIFSSAPDSSHLSYCDVAECGNDYGVIQCSYSNPVIAHCTIKDNWSTFYGCILLQYSGPRIAHCTIRDNITLFYGAGICMFYSSPEISHCNITGNGNMNTPGGGIYCSSGCTAQISHCNITGNFGNYGGGVYVEGTADPEISNCIIDSNVALCGGGIAFMGGSGTIRDCIINADSSLYGSSAKGGGILISSPNGTFIISNSTISNCYTNRNGSGIHIDDADSVIITGSTFSYNICGWEEGAIYSANCTNLIIDHCTLVRNQCGLLPDGITLNGNTNLILSNSVFRSQFNCDIYFMSYSSASVSYCDFYGAPMGAFNGGPAGLETLVQVNANGDSCDVFYNIFLDPLFVDFSNRDYHLTEDSPCIDAGDPMSPNDPDGTVTDMGRYYYDQSALVVPSAIADLTIFRDALDVYLVWSQVTTDTSGSPITVSRYVIYASESAFFEPVAGDSIEFVVPPDTSITDSNALLNVQRFYNVKARIEN